MAYTAFVTSTTPATTSPHICTTGSAPAPCVRDIPCHPRRDRQTTAVASPSTPTLRRWLAVLPTPAVTAGRWSSLPRPGSRGGGGGLPFPPPL